MATFTRYVFELKLECDNAAFEEDRAAEIARILRRLADRLDTGSDPDHVNAINGNRATNGWLRDGNGNSAGTWKANQRRVPC